MPDGTLSERLRLSIVVEWANTRLHGRPRALRMLEHVARQWREIRDGKLPAGLPRESVRWLERLEPRAELLIMSGEPLDPRLERAVRALLVDSFELSIHVAEGLEYYALKNLGIDRASGDLLLLVDSDVQPDEGWLAHLLGSFARPEISVVEGQTYVAPTDLFSTAFSLGWTYDLRDEGAGLIRPEKVYANNIAFRAEILGRNRFRQLGWCSRGAASQLRRDLERVGILIWENRRAAVDHPAPTSFRHMGVRALAHGRDHYLKVSERRSLPAANRSACVAGRRLARGIARALRHRRRVGLEIWELPAVFGIMASYYAVFALGAALTLVWPEAMGRRFRV